MSYRRVRPALFLGLVPMLMLFELDRELSGDVSGATARMALDIVLLLTCAQDLLRPMPKRPRTTAAIFFGAGARLAVLIARSCGANAHPVIYVASILGFAIAVLTWLSRPRVAPSDPLAAEGAQTPTIEGSFPRALAFAVLLPIALVIAGHYGGTWIQALVLALGGLLLPPIAVPKCDDMKPPRSAHFSAKFAIACTVVGIALTAGVTGGAHYSIDAIAAAVACMHASESSSAATFIAREGAEVVKNVQVARADIAFFAMTVFVSPLFEERIFRGMLQRIASARFGKNRGIAIAGIAFGLAHLGVYRIAVYQAILLGVTFGITFEEGGLAASIATHAIWNLYLLL